MEVFAAYGAPVLLGLFIGVCSGLLGIGGGTILVPAFRLLFGMSPLESTATSMFTIIPTSISGALTHIRQKTVNVPLGIVLGLGGACMSPVGVLLATVSPPWLVMVTAALIIGYSAVNMFWKALRMKTAGKRGGITEIPVAKREEKSALDEHFETSTGETPENRTEETGENREAETSEGEKNKPTLRKVLIAIAIGLAAGLASGYVGVGGGFIMIPLMLAFLGITMKQASGTSLVAIIILSIPGVISQTLLGNVHYLTGLIVAVGSIPGAILGAHLLQIIPERTLRFIFGVFLIIAAVLLALNEFHVLG